MKVDEHNILVEKAKSKKDGVYSYRGYLYVVKNNNFKAFASPYGILYAVIGSFTTQIGFCQRHDSRTKLLQYLNRIKKMT